MGSLEQIMLQNTDFYRSDFEIDKKILEQNADSDKTEDKTLLWMSRQSGTYLFRERDVFLKDTSQFITWKYYTDHSYDHILAYAVEITGKEGEKIMGNLYELDYMQHSCRVKDKAVPFENYVLYYEKGERVHPARKHFDAAPDPHLGKLERFEAQPNDPDTLRYVLREEQEKRNRLKPGEIKVHIALLHTRRASQGAVRKEMSGSRISMVGKKRKCHQT